MRQGSVENVGLNELLAGEPVLPYIPRMLALLLHEVGRTEPDLRRLCEWIAADPALAALTLRVANANRFRQSACVSNIAQALAVLGPMQLRQIAQTAAGSGVIHPVPELPLPVFWRYSVNTAKVARALASSLRLDGSTAFCAGLVHALGELLILGNASMRSRMAQTQVPPLDLLRAAAESSVLGFCHADVIAALASTWHWPEELVEILHHQVRPFESDACEPLAGVLHLAVWRARTREADLDANALTVSFPFEVAVPLDLDIDAVLQQDPIDWNPRLAAATWY